jgi:hypothetical protein
VASKLSHLQYLCFDIVVQSFNYFNNNFLLFFVFFGRFHTILYFVYAKLVFFCLIFYFILLIYNFLIVRTKKMLLYSYHFIFAFSDFLRTEPSRLLALILSICHYLIFNRLLNFPKFLACNHFFAYISCLQIL